MFNSAKESGFGSVVLLLMIFVLTVAIGYSVSQVNKPTFKKSLAYEGDAAAGIDTFNLDAIIQTGLDGIQNVINNQVDDANKVLNNPNSTPDQKKAAGELINQRVGKPDSDQAILYQKFGKVEMKDGKPDYTARNERINQQWDAAADKKVAPPRNGFQSDVGNHTPINDNSSNRAVAQAAAAAALRK